MLCDRLGNVLVSNQQYNLYSQKINIDPITRKKKAKIINYTYPLWLALGNTADRWRDCACRSHPPHLSLHSVQTRLNNR
ncbi:hypothetical protein BpHYR1_025529 [Brachionus plicatilis]|uniref:Uncharacterized protein n=1 Tax=Brachionus plicatilis TaxID=10195 RepID=A0A3M7RBK9_BRAPC|nr:hypothetical protein BpHYR1_025529 [Brachionus plicatilis]